MKALAWFASGAVVSGLIVSAFAGRYQVQLVELDQDAIVAIRCDRFTGRCWAAGNDRAHQASALNEWNPVEEPSKRSDQK